MTNMVKYTFKALFVMCFYEKQPNTNYEESLKRERGKKSGKGKHNESRSNRRSDKMEFKTNSFK